MDNRLHVLSRCLYVSFGALFLLSAIPFADGFQRAPDECQRVFEPIADIGVWIDHGCMGGCPGNLPCDPLDKMPGPGGTESWFCACQQNIFPPHIPRPCSPALTYDPETDRWFVECLVAGCSGECSSGQNQLPDGTIYETCFCDD